MKQLNNIEQNFNSNSIQKEDILDLTLGLILTFFVSWGIYIGVNLHL